jgi:hypothetical protein
MPSTATRRRSASSQRSPSRSETRACPSDTLGWSTCTGDDTDEAGGDTDEAGGDTEEPGDDTDAGDSDVDTDDTDDASLPTRWSGTWSLSWEYEEQDLNHPGPGQLWEPRSSSCTSGIVALSLGEDGTVRVESPFGVCQTGTQIGWTHMMLAASMAEGTTSITGDALFGSLGGAPVTVMPRMGLQITGSVGDDGPIPNGLLTISGSRSQNQVQPYESLVFSATLRPVVD